MSLYSSYANGANLRGGWRVYNPSAVRSWSLEDWFAFEPDLIDVTTQIMKLYNVPPQTLTESYAMAYILDTAIQEGDEAAYREVQDYLRQNPVIKKWVKLVREMIHRGTTRRSKYDKKAIEQRREAVRAEMKRGKWFGSDPFVPLGNGKMGKRGNFALLQPTWGKSGLRRVTRPRNLQVYAPLGIQRYVKIRRNTGRGNAAAAVGNEAAQAAAAAAVNAVQQGASPAQAVQQGAQAGAEQANLRGQQIQAMQPRESVNVPVVDQPTMVDDAKYRVEVRPRSQHFQSYLERPTLLRRVTKLRRRPNVQFVDEDVPIDPAEYDISDGETDEPRDDLN